MQNTNDTHRIYWTNKTSSKIQRCQNSQKVLKKKKKKTNNQDINRKQLILQMSPNSNLGSSTESWRPNQSPENKIPRSKLPS